jgi:two-component system chemotaxis response regulator CheY
LITSLADSKAAETLVQHGHTVQLSKPFDQDQLAQALAAAGGPRRAPGPDDPNSPGRTRVLVVDDSATARGHIRRVLAGLGVTRIVEAADGVEAMCHLEEDRFDLVVTDYNMPRLDGGRLIDFIRHRSLVPSIPVIMVTT